MAQHPLERLFSPRAVAIVGASPEFTRYGGRVLQYLHEFGFEGPIWPINPRYPEIRGLPCYPNLRSLPGAPDHVGIAVGQDKLFGTLEECAAVGVPFVTIFSAGFGELGTEEGRAQQRRMVEFARSHGIRIVGPNCNGVVNWKRRLALAGTAAVLGWDDRPAGGVAVLSQSGGAGAVNVMWRVLQAGLGISYHASCGNEADLDMLDVTDYVLEDPGTRVVLLFAERIASREKLAKVSSRAAELGKPILILKLGRSEGGKRAAASHTGALAGSDAVHDAAFRQLGIIRVDEPQHLYQAAMLFEQGRRVEAEGVAAVSSSGGNVVLAADQAERLGVAFPPFVGATRDALSTLVPGYINFGNPLDLSPEVIGNAGLFRRVFDVIAADPQIGFFMPIVTLAPRRDVEALLDVLVEAPKPAAMVWTGGASRGEPAPETDRMIRGIPVYRDTDTALRSMGTVIRHRRLLERHARRRKPERPGGIDAEAARTLVTTVDGRILPERVAKQVLAAYGICGPKEALARDRDQLGRILATMRLPVAMKIESPGIAHKTEAGGVRLGVSSEAEAMKAFDEILEAVCQKAPDAQVSGVLVQEMVPPGLELIFGFSRDEIYGPVVAVGMGGILVEVFRDTALRLPPLTEDEARAALSELRGAPLFGAVRGRPARDLGAAVDVLVRLSWMAADLADVIDEVDVNPVILLEHGAAAVDALIVRRLTPAHSA